MKPDPKALKTQKKPRTKGNGKEKAPSTRDGKKEPASTKGKEALSTTKDKEAPSTKDKKAPSTKDTRFTPGEIEEINYGTHKITPRFNKSLFLLFGDGQLDGREWNRRGSDGRREENNGKGDESDGQQDGRGEWNGRGDESDGQQDENRSDLNRPDRNRSDLNRPDRNRPDGQQNRKRNRSVLYICSKCLSRLPSGTSLEIHMEGCRIPFPVIYQEGDPTGNSNGEKNSTSDNGRNSASDNGMCATGNKAVDPTSNKAVNSNKRMHPTGTGNKAVDSFTIALIPTIEDKQMLSMLSCMFIKSKTVFYEVDAYDYFIICTDEIVGYFSRHRKDSVSLNCLFVWPCFQGAGWGTLLIDFSQVRRINCRGERLENWRESDGKGENWREGERMKRESVKEKRDNTGTDSTTSNSTTSNSTSNNTLPVQNTPERPFSKEGIFAYRKYWKYKVIGGTSINQIAKDQNLSVDDVIVGLELNGFDFRKWELKGEIEVKRPRLLKRRVFRDF